MSDLKDIYDRDIKPRLDLVAVLAPLRPRKVHGNIYLLCPNCGENSAFIKEGWDVIGCNRRNGCSTYTSILTYLNGGTIPRGQVWAALIKKLGKEVGVDIPDREWTPEQKASTEKRRQEEDVLGRVLQVCHAALLSNTEATTYLLSRGFELERLEHLEFGLFNRQFIDQVVSAEEQTPLGLHRIDWDGRLILPIKDRYGNLRALNGRDLTGTASSKFYKTHGFSPDHIVVEGLDEARKYEHILLGESSMAIHSFREAGLTQMTAIGSSKMNSERWVKLADLGIKSVTLWLDNDKAGVDGTVHAIEKYLEAERRPDLYIIDPVAVAPHNDPDEYLRHGSRENLNLLIANPLPFNTYLARAWATQCNLATSIGMREYEDKAATYLSKLDGREAQEAWQNFFQNGVKKLTNIDEDFLFDYMGDIRAKQQQRTKDEKLEALRKLIESGTKMQDVETVAEALSEATQQLRALAHKIDLKPLVVTSERLSHHDRYLVNCAGKEFLGLPQHTIKPLDLATRGLRGLTTIAAGPGAGKTTLLQQLCTDVLKHDPDVCCVIITLEMSEEELLTRLKSRVLGKPFDEIMLKNDQAMRERANELVTDVLSRTFIIDTTIYPEVTAELIIRDIARLKAETGCKKVIVGVDYVQVFPIPEAEKKNIRGDQDRDTYITEQMLKIRKAISPDPLLAISEINKTDQFKAEGMHSLKGSSRLPYASDNVILVNQIPEDQLLSVISYERGSFSLKVRQKKGRYSKRKKNDDGLSEEQEAEAIEMLTGEMDRQGKDFVELRIVKVRGGKRKSMILVHKHICSDMRELTEDGESTGG